MLERDIGKLTCLVAGALPDEPLPVAIAVSGGPDSMALCWLLHEAAQKNQRKLHAFTVDHGLRADSAREAERVHKWLQVWPHITHRVLNLSSEIDPVGGRIQERARAARYEALLSACRTEGIERLYLAHHQDDQAETFLMRLAAGSGLRGLGGMQTESVRDGITLVRPLLEQSKDTLLALCAARDIPFVHDPTNDNQNHLRPRLRAARAVLEEEGLSAARLSQTAQRLRRAEDALDIYAHEAWSKLSARSGGGVFFALERFVNLPEDMRVRLLMRALQEVGGSGDDQGYGPRLHKLESLMAEMFVTPLARQRRTLGGCLVTLDPQENHLLVEAEMPKI